METEQSSKFLIPLAIVAAGVLVAGAIYFGAGTPKTTGNSVTEPTTASIDVKPVTDKDHIVGSVNADLVIVEYSDTECPFCKSFQGTMKEVVRTYGGRVAWVYRQFPIVQLHSKAPKEAEATECATELGGNQAFWNYINKVFDTTNSNDSLDPAQLPKIAVSVGLDETAFNKCLSSGKYTDIIKKAIGDAVAAGARGTPYSVIIAKKDGSKTIINGAEPLAQVKVKIDTLLK